MARNVRAILVDLDLRPETYGLRNGLAEPVRSDAADVRWDLHTSVRTATPGGWEHLGLVWPARLTLALDTTGAVPIDDPASLGRTADLPLLSAAGVRAWERVQLATSEPTDTSVRWRIVSTSALWWSGAAWTAATLDAHWNTSAEVEAHFAALPSSHRAITFRALLESTDIAARPEVYGARVLLSVRDLGDEDDALVRTLVPAMRDAIGSSAIVRQVLSQATRRLVPPAGWPYRVTGAPTAYNLTADPNELVPLAGTWDGDAFVLATTLAAGRSLLVEWPIEPRIETAVHRDSETPETTPAIYVFPDGDSERFCGIERAFVTSAQDGTPEGESVPAPDLVALRLEVRVVCELAADARRLASELDGWVAAHSEIASPETGRVIGLRSLSPIVSTAGALSSGVVDARGTWEIAFHTAGAHSADAVDYVRDGGVLYTVGDPEE